MLRNHGSGESDIKSYWNYFEKTSYAIMGIPIRIGTFYRNDNQQSVPIFLKQFNNILVNSSRFIIITLSLFNYCKAI